MLQTTTPTDAAWNAVDLVERFGPIPLTRIYHQPPPGCATESDLEELCTRSKWLYELVDGTLVEKTVGHEESALTLWLAMYLCQHVKEHDLGILTGADGPFRLESEQIRIPDIGFVSWQRYPHRRVPKGYYQEGSADLAVEVISPSNTKQEMATKLTEYFAAGSQLVWYVYPLLREVHVFTSAEACTILQQTDTLTGGEVLPGFALPLHELFAQLGDADSS